MTITKVATSTRAEDTEEITLTTKDATKIETIPMILKDHANIVGRITRKSTTGTDEMTLVLPSHAHQLLMAKTHLRVKCQTNPWRIRLLWLSQTQI